MDKEIRKAINILRAKDEESIRELLIKEKNNLEYDMDYCGWFINCTDARTYIFDENITLLNPKDLESTIDAIIEEEIFPVEETALDFISYYESKWGLDNVTEDKIYEKVNSDAEFHIFEHMGLSDEVIKQLSTGINYYFEEQQIEYWRNEMSNIIRKEYLPLTLEEIESKKEKFKNKDFNIYINRAYKSTCSIEELKEMMKNEI